MRRHVLLASILLLMTTGCAGKDFVRAQPESLTIGQTTETEIRQRFGNPYREGTQVKNGETMKTLSYAYNTGAPSLAGGVNSAREQGFYFWNGVLVGHDFTSSFDQDRTDFVVSRVKRIKKEETTEAEVVTLFGRPQGMYSYPLIPDKGDRAIVYRYHQTKGSVFNLKFYQQLLVVTLDSTGLVKDSQFTSAGQR